MALTLSAAAEFNGNFGADCVIHAHAKGLRKCARPRWTYAPALSISLLRIQATTSVIASPFGRPFGLPVVSILKAIAFSDLSH